MGQSLSRKQEKSSRPGRRWQQKHSYRMSHILFFSKDNGTYAHPSMGRHEADLDWIQQGSKYPIE